MKRRPAELKVCATTVIFAAMVSTGVVQASRPAFRAGEQAQAATPRTHPKLAVLIVVDQMRADYVDRFAADWTGGFKRLLTTGAVYTNAAYPYFQTWTCSGHATISTGTFPHTHGIVQNEWPTNDPRQEPWCVDDPRTQDIGYTRAPVGSHSPWQLRVPTFADVMRASEGARVVSVSLKADAAIMLAGHGGDAVTWVSDRLDTLATSTAYTSRPVPAVAAFARANPIEQYAKRTWDRLLPAARYAEADAAVGELPPPGWTSTFPHTLSAAGVLSDADFRVQWQRSPFVDEYVAQLATSLADSFQLGTRATTDVLAISFSATDEVGHLFGPRSQEVHDTLVRLDRTLGALFAHLDAALGAGTYVVALSADHGVTPIPEQARQEGRDAGRIDPVGVAYTVERTLTAAWGQGPYVSAIAGTNMNVYFMPGVAERLRASPQVLDAVVRNVQQMPGVARVFTAGALGSVDQADPLARAVALSYFPGRSGEVIVAIKPGWNATTAPAMHGNATADDQRVPLVLAGFGVKPGRYAQAVTPADIAPTLAELCGASMPRTEGRVLREALK